MVNHPTRHRSEILVQLRREAGSLSGEELGGRIGISRVAVWKHVRHLREEGYRIEADGRGYSLVEEPDHLSPSEPSLDPERVHVLDRVESTMGASQGSEPSSGGVEFWVAKEQSAGRGRVNKEWESPPGGLYCSALFRPTLPLAYLNLYLIRSGMVLADALSTAFGLEVLFVWPNDLFLGGRKLGGLLLEAEGESESPRRASLGIGINAAPSSLSAAEGISLQEALDAAGSKLSSSPKELFRLIEPPIEEALGPLEPEKVRREWELVCLVKSRPLIEAKGFPGRPEGMSLSAGLISRGRDGAYLEISPGGRIIGEYPTFI